MNFPTLVVGAEPVAGAASGNVGVWLKPERSEVAGVIFGALTEDAGPTEDGALTPETLDGVPEAAPEPTEPGWVDERLESSPWVGSGDPPPPAKGDWPPERGWACVTSGVDEIPGGGAVLAAEAPGPPVTPVFAVGATGDVAGERGDVGAVGLVGDVPGIDGV